MFEDEFLIRYGYVTREELKKIDEDIARQCRMEFLIFFCSGIAGFILIFIAAINHWI